jgi:DNA-binding response OmpR family regulator
MARVLLIDDDHELLDVLGEWLMCRGHAVRLLADGHRAFEEARDFGPDVVLLDGVLRGITGPVVAERLRAGGHSGIIYLSGLPRGELPCDVPLIEKPIDLDVLDRTIQLMVA